MSQIFATQLTAVATTILAGFAVVTAVFAFLAFRKQSQEVGAIEQQVKDEQQLTQQQAELLQVQSGQLDLQRRAVEAAQRTALSAQQTLALETRAFLVPARRDDPVQHIVFHGGHWLVPDVAGGRAVFQDTGDSIYMGVALRNVGLGLALLYGWHLSRGLLTPEIPPGDFDSFIPLSRALHVPPRDVGFWQAQARPQHRPIVRAANAAGEPLTVDLLYGNEEGGQGRITRFHLRVLDDHPRSVSERSCEVARHWSIDTLEGTWPKQGQLRLVIEPASPEE